MRSPVNLQVQVLVSSALDELSAGRHCRARTDRARPYSVLAFVTIAMLQHKFNFSC